MQNLANLLPSAPLTGNSSMAASNTITDQAGSFTASGSPSEAADGIPMRAPQPQIDPAVSMAATEDSASGPAAAAQAWHTMPGMGFVADAAQQPRDSGRWRTV